MSAIIFFSVSVLNYPENPVGLARYTGLRVEDKQKVADLTCIPWYLPEVTIGAHDYDEAYYAFKSEFSQILKTPSGKLAVQ
ncbi:UNVERIFIED_CONTAM: hypothetical protein FKN15_000890 [Acipenser sinensis]